jgi:hypothetical protein
LDLQQREAAITAQQQAVAAAEAAVTRERSMLARERQQLQVGAGSQRQASYVLSDPANAKTLFNTYPQLKATWPQLLSLFLSAYLCNYPSFQLVCTV